MIRSKYLAATSGGLQVPAAMSTTPNEVVPLTEILDLLFRFVHPRAEGLRRTTFGAFFPLAEAAEKHQVFGAMNTCFTRLEYVYFKYVRSPTLIVDHFGSQLIKQHPIEVLNHSHRHGYFNIADQAAIETIALPLNKITKGLTHPGLLQRWVRTFFLFNPHSLV